MSLLQLLRPVLLIVGTLVLVLAAAMLVPTAVDLALGNPDWQAFVAAAAGTAFVGGLLILANRGVPVALSLRQAFILTTVSWLSVSALSAAPFALSALDMTYTDAFFEAISGLTTTGSTVITGLESVSPGIKLWRGLLQWLGGIGIIAMAIAMLPYLKVGGMQLFRMESSERSPKILPRPAQIAQGIGLVYVSLTLACAGLYYSAGMSGFDAVVHAMTTLSTGGYSNYDTSIGHFRDPAIEWIGVAFMLLGSLPFILYLRCLRGDVLTLLRDQQVRGFVGLVLVVTLVLSLWLWAKGNFPFLVSLRLVTFNVVSIITTTGYVSTDYERWIQGTEMLFLLLTFVGGCTGSTAGAIKFFRFHFLWLVTKRHLRVLLYPHAVIPLSYNGRPASMEIAGSVAGFFFAFIAAVALLAMALSALGLDFLTSLSGAATAMSNVGPGLGAIIGPAGTFETLPDSAKWLLSLGMLLGRLELFTILVLVVPRLARL